MKKTDIPTVIIVGQNYVSNLCMARALSQAGYEVDVLRIFRKDLTWRNRLGSMNAELRSKYIKKYIPCVINGDGAALVEQLVQIAIPGKKTMVIPNDDLSASIVDAHLDMLEPYFCIPNIAHKSGEIVRFMRKGIQKELAREAGLLTVNGWTIHVAGGRFQIPKDITYPCFIKPNVSKDCTKDIMKRCENEQELQEVLKVIGAKQDVEILAEEYIEIRREYSVLGAASKNGVYSPGIFVVEEGGHGTWKGVTMVGKVLPFEKFRPLLNQINAFVKNLNFEGLFDVDLIESMDGRMYFVEINFRFGGSGYAVTGSGVNLPGMFADYMYTGKIFDTDREIKTERVFVNEKILMDEYAKGYLNRKDVAKRLKKADIRFVKDEEDRIPYLFLLGYYWASSLKRMFKGH